MQHPHQRGDDEQNRDCRTRRGTGFHCSDGERPQHPDSDERSDATDAQYGR